jgi:hypothetical protein
MYKILFILIVISLPINSLSALPDSLKIKGKEKQITDSLIVNKKFPAVDTTSIKDSLNPVKDSLKTHKPKPLIPLYQKGFLSTYDFGTTLTHQQILFSDYRYTGDFISLFPFGFIRDMGVLGQPNEVLVYGAGFNNISFMQDGITLNNRFTNAYDLNELQSESIDSIEIIPSVRGFLYGNSMNPVSVNFISKNDFNIEGKKGAYSRLRYYQAPNEEAFIDAIFKTNITQRLTSVFEMTNSSITNQFQNSDYSSWKGNARLNYLLSDNFNLVGNYNYVKSEVHLFGGLDLDSLSKMTNSPANDLGYPVISNTRYQKSTEHNTYLKLVNKLSTHLSGDLTAYYKYNLIEFRQSDYDTIPNGKFIFRDHVTKIIGGTLRETFQDSILVADFIANYEKAFIKSGFFDFEKRSNSASISGRLSLKLDKNKIIPSVFGKYLYVNYNTYAIDHLFYGIGGDITVNLSNSFSLYGGVSYFQKSMNPLEGFRYTSKNQNITSGEIGLKASLQQNHASINLFYRKTDYVPYKALYGPEYLYIIGSYKNEIIGGSINLSAYVWKIILDLNTAYYNNNKYKYLASYYSDYYVMDDNAFPVKYFLPEYSISGGIYYSDILFKSNLNLKVGINARAVGKQNLYSYNYETSTYLDYYSDPYEINSTLKPSIIFNFLLIGEIQKRAIIYFTFENLFDKEYYIVPYYRKQGRGMRLGVSWEFLN